jgi:hypothetical protein
MRERSFGGTGRPGTAFDIDGTAVAGGADEGNAARGFRGCAGGRTLDVGRAAGGADEDFPVPISGDQNQGFGCAVFLDAPTSHGRPLRR